MKPIDFRDETWSTLQGRLVGLRRRVYEAWLSMGPATTREVARESGIDILTFRPRTTELFQMGAVVLVEELSKESTEGVYNARTPEEWRAWVAQQRAAMVSGQLQLV